ncbi:MAG: efflux RND transporter permease subunit [Saprospiraceae bacterium]
MITKYRNLIIGVFAALALGSAVSLFFLKFSFNFEDFFPQGDPDLQFFERFKEKFEADDNFLLIAVENKEGVFEQDFLEKFDSLGKLIKPLKVIKDVQSITTIKYPIISPLFTTQVDAVHIDDPSRYEEDKKRLLEDERFVGNLISEDATSVVLFAKTVDKMPQEEAENLMDSVRLLVNSFGFDDQHYLGRSNFQKELVRMQKREIIVSAAISNVLVIIILFLIFRTFWGTVISMGSVVLGLLLFMGFLGATGRELNAMAALYPVLMVIVGTSDVIHILSKYIDELKKGKEKEEAIWIAIKEIGLATLLTSITTAIGFASLVSSRIYPIRDFGINAAFGVIIAYITVVFFTTAVVSKFDVNQIIKLGKGESFWTNLMVWFNKYTKNNHRKIIIGGVATIAICVYGISLITTNYRIEGNLPKGGEITKDFLFFEKNFVGFRPFEIAVFVKGDYKADDYKVVQEIIKIENHLAEYPEIQRVNSITTIYKSINKATKANRQSAYKMPESQAKFEQYKRRYVEKLPDDAVNVLISKDEKNTRISGRILDIGADNIREITTSIDDWAASNLDTSIITMKQTGTSLVVDKNSQYVRNSILWGLGLAMLIVSVLMVLLFQNLKMLIISIIPNLIPLLIAGAVLGFGGVELEAGISIVFAIIFGIAVDDTIHFLSKFKLARNKGLSVDDAIEITFLETGKAICLTTVILFFGFMILLFSVHPPSIIVGTLISVTLFSALFGDLFFIPVLIRMFIKD